jgi:4-hydroxy-tetrahydrodipicolinate reductase
MDKGILVAGICGRMGHRVAELVSAEQGLELAAGVEREGHPSAGQSLIFSGTSVKVFEGFSPDVPWAHLLVDFSSPQGTEKALAFSLGRKIPLLSGTTGHSEEGVKALRAAASRIPILLSPNMSTGMTLLARFLPQIVSAAGEQCDIEIVEKHHRAKKDSPSGTAIRLARAISDASQGTSKPSVRFARTTEKPEVRGRDIYVHSIRAGDVVGEHTVVLGLRGERIEIKHVAESRDCFAFGTISAIKFLLGKRPGWYTMDDVVLATSSNKR